MNHFIKHLLWMSLFCASSTAIAQVENIKTMNYDEINKIIVDKEARHSAEKVLLVFDIDNTLLTSGTRLGGDIWYQWQTGKLALKPSAEQKVSCLYDNAIALLYELGPMQLTEPQLPELMQQWQQKHTAFALTSRAPDTQYATQRELQRNGIDFTSFDNRTE